MLAMVVLGVGLRFIQELRAGDWLSIDGRTGNIFISRIPTLAQPTLGDSY